MRGVAELRAAALDHLPRRDARERAVEAEADDADRDGAVLHGEKGAPDEIQTTPPDPKRLLTDYATWIAAPPRLSPTSARTRVLAALVSPAPRRRLRLASVGALAAVLAALLYGMHLAVAVVADGPRGEPERATWPPPAPRSRLLVVHTLSTGTPVYVFAAPARP